MTAVWYCTRERVKAALDMAETARNNVQVDAAIGAGARSIERRCHRLFYPTLATRYFTWPTLSPGSPWRLWLEADEVITVSQLVAGGVVIPSTDYFLEPANLGPPFAWIEIDRASASAFSSGATSQRAIELTGHFGYSANEEQVGDLADTLAADVTDTASVTWTTARIGVGDVLRIDSERVIVTGRTMVDSTQNLQTAMTADASNTTVAVTSGSAFAVEDILLLDSERMLVTDIAGNNLTVKRAYDGTALATHSGSDIYHLTGIEISRAQLGTTLASHSSGADIFRLVHPELISELNAAEAINTIQQEQSGYGRTVGSGENAREAAGRGINDIRRDVDNGYRRGRSGAI